LPIRVIAKKKGLLADGKHVSVVHQNVETAASVRVFLRPSPHLEERRLFYSASSSSSTRHSRSRTASAVLLRCITSLERSIRSHTSGDVRACWIFDPDAPGRDQMQVLLTVTSDASGVARVAMVALPDVPRLSDPLFSGFAERARQAAMAYAVFVLRALVGDCQNRMPGAQALRPVLPGPVPAVCWSLATLWAGAVNSTAGSWRELGRYRPGEAAGMLLTRAWWHQTRPPSVPFP
jgi:hypothetical protein